MFVLFTTRPGLSHLQPMLPLAAELRAIGHQVTFATAASFCASVAAYGFKTFAAGHDYELGHEEPLFSGLRESRQGRARHFSYTREVLGGLAEQMADDLLMRARVDQAPDLIVRDSVEFGGCIAAEALGIPHATGRENRFLPPSVWARQLSEVLNRVRIKHGLARDPDLEMLYRHLGLAHGPREYVVAAPECDTDEFGSFIHPALHFCRPVPFDASSDDEPPRWIERLQNRTMIYASLGTVFNRQPELCRAILSAFTEDTEMRFVLTVGPTQDPEDFEPVPSHVTVSRYVPQSWLFPYCSVVITAGGFGTVMAALGHGLPMVMLPLNADQHVNARRCEVLGAAVTVPPHLRHATGIRDAVRRVMLDPGFRASAVKLSEDIAALPSPAQAAGMLEQLVVGGPVLARSEDQTC